MLRDGLGLPAYDMAKIFECWNAGELGAYLIEITADILLQDGTDGPIDRPDCRPGASEGNRPVGEVIAALELGVAAPTLSKRSPRAICRRRNRA